MARQTQGSMLCPSCRKLISVAVDKCPHCGAARPGLWGFGPSVSRALGRVDAVQAITVMCLGLYVLGLAIDPRAALGGGGGMLGILSPSGQALRFLGSTHPIDLRVGHWWTLLTAIYLHGGVLHILFNVMWIRSLAPEVQRGFGTARFFLLWTFAGALGFLISNLVPDARGSVGASGSIFGLMGALIVYGRAVGAQLMTRQIWGYALVLGMLGFFMPGVDNFAHVGGFAGGWIAATLFRPSIGKPEGRGLTIAALVTAAVTVLGFVLNIGMALTYLIANGRG